MAGWTELLDLFWCAIAAALIAGVVCPLVGCFLYLRHTSFYGIALPQFAAAGIACGFAVLASFGGLLGLAPAEAAELLEDSHTALNWHLSWAGAFTFGGLLLLVLTGRRGGSEVARVAAAFAIASAATVLFAHASPTGEIYVHELLRGEILAIGPHELETIVAVLAAVFLAIFVFHRDLLIVSYDPETARVLGKPVLAFEALLLLLTGLTVSAGVMTVGPVVVFGLLVLPPLGARGLARSMRAFYSWASLLGLVSAILGVWISFLRDLPLGPTLVVSAAVLCLPGGLRGLVHRARA